MAGASYQIVGPLAIVRPRWWANELLQADASRVRSRRCTSEQCVAVVNLEVQEFKEHALKFEHLTLTNGCTSSYT
jgi:hypothetical protein